MPTRSLDSDTTGAVPFEYSGKWIAWNSDHSQIVAAADHLEDLWRIVREREIVNPIFGKVPRANVRFVGKR